MAGIGHNRSRNQNRQQVLDDLFILSFTAERQDVQVRACVAWLNLVEGAPVMRGISVNARDFKKSDDDALRIAFALIETNKK